MSNPTPAEIKARHEADTQRRLGLEDPIAIYDQDGQRVIRFTSTSDTDLPKHVVDALKSKLGNGDSLSYWSSLEGGKAYVFVEDRQMKPTYELARDLENLTGNKVEEKKLMRPVEERIGQVGPSSPPNGWGATMEDANPAGSQQPNGPGKSRKAGPETTHSL